jgi:hypothetical protein
MPAETTKSLESWLWDAACSIRGAKRTLLRKLMTVQICVSELELPHACVLAEISHDE